MNRILITETINSALASARQIALAARADPKKYLIPEIENWRKQYVASRIYGSTSPGFFDRLLDEAQAEISAVATDPPIFPGFAGYDFDGQATGEAAESDAVLKYLGWMNYAFQAVRVIDFFKEWDVGIATKDSARLLRLYKDGPRFWMLCFQTLFNTMQKKMDQAERPKPVPGPDEMIIHTSFGDVIVKKSPRKIAELTVDEFRALMSELLQK